MPRKLLRFMDDSNLADVKRGLLEVTFRIPTRDDVNHGSRWEENPLLKYEGLLSEVRS